MNYREIINKYKNGSASPEEAEQISQEIEKHEAISEYLADELEDAIAFDHLADEYTAQTDMDKAHDEVHLVKRLVNQKMHRNIASSVLIILCLFMVTLLFYVLYFGSFYNPNNGVTSDDNDNRQFYFDTAVFSRLHTPGYEVTDASASSEGFGTYYINIRTMDKFAGHNSLVYTDKILRGKLLNHPTTLWRLPTVSSFTGKGVGMGWATDEDDTIRYDQQESERQYYLEELSKLPDSARASAYLTFRDNITLNQLSAMLRKLEEEKSIDFIYAGVRTQEYPMPAITGICLSPSVVTTDDEPPLYEEYPYLELGFHTWFLEDALSNEELAEIWEKHFIDQLRYMASRQEFLETMVAISPYSSDFYTELLDYVDSSGIQVYGVLVYADVKDLLDFAQQDLIQSIVINNAKLSPLMKLNY